MVGRGEGRRETDLVVGGVVELFVHVLEGDVGRLNNNEVVEHD